MTNYNSTITLLDVRKLHDYRIDVALEDGDVDELHRLVNEVHNLNVSRKRCELMSYQFGNR